MRKAAALIGIVPVLVVASSAVGHSSAEKTTRCKVHGFTYYAHGMSCAAVKKAVNHGNKGFTCREVGHRTRPPFTEKCTKNKNHRVYFTLQFNGG